MPRPNAHTRGPCRHCGRGCYHKAYRLCSGCWSAAEVRAQYAPPTNDPPAPAAPTLALPGSAAKVAELAQRRAAGHALWHSGDAGLPWDAEVAVELLRRLSGQRVARRGRQRRG